MKRRHFAAAALFALVAAFVIAQPGTHVTRARAGFDYQELNDTQQKILSGFVSYELTSGNSGTDSSAPSQYFPRGSGDCSTNLQSNIKVNQNCLNLSDPDLQGRAQAQNETSIAQDPNNPNHIIGSYNDYRRGDSTCGVSWSTDKGRTWNDATMPTSFTRGNAFGAAREYWQGGGDTSVAWDTKGNAYLSCQVFNRGDAVSPNQDQSSAFYVYRSTGNGGASWNFPGRPVRESNDEQATGNQPFLDKQLMTVDNHVGSPFQDRVYVTWTEFASDGSAYIWEAYSADYAEHFSDPVLVSADSNYCTNTFGAGTAHGRCNENQFSQPFTSPDGTLYVTWANYNNQASVGNDNRYQILIAKSVDGGQTFSPPQKVSDFYELPECATYQGGKDAGRACVPEKGPTSNSYFRATNYPSGSVNPTQPNQVVVTLGSYINRHSNESNGCVPAGFGPFGNPQYTGVKTPGACNNDIIVSISNDAGTTFSGTAADPRTEPVATTAPGQATTDQWFQWATFTKTGKLAVSYYDRQYGDDETTGYSDTRNPELFACRDAGGNISLPPSVCTGSADNAPIANDQDAYIAANAVPSG
ncbi:MAG: glycoside hydrolase [Actinobacteria bacterium]|nr:glycoside hydrolase [Actinomycetota bacterium]